MTHSQPNGMQRTSERADHNELSIYLQQFIHRSDHGDYRYRVPSHEMRGLRGQATRICVGGETNSGEKKEHRKWSTGYISSRVTWPAETCH